MRAFCFLLLLFAFSFLHALPNAKVEVTAAVDRSAITIGDRLRYEISVVCPSEGKVELPAVLGNLGAFEVKDYQTQENKTKDGRLQVTHAFTLSTFTVGAYTLPPQRVEYREGKDTTALVLYTQPTEIQVQRTSPETVKDIADITDVASMPEPRPWGAIALGLALLSAIGFWAWRKFRGKAETDKPVPQLPPDKEALQRLRALNAVQLLRQNRAREFAFALSEILRNYIGRRFDIDALESTTPEFLAKVKPLPLTLGQRDWLRAVCDHLDQSKYATGLVLESDAERWIKECEAFVEKTRPIAEAQDSGEPKAK